MFLALTELHFLCFLLTCPSRTAFFTTCFVKANTELCWDYEYSVGNVEGKSKKCLCGADNCKKRWY